MLFSFIATLLLLGSAAVAAPQGVTPTPSPPPTQTSSAPPTTSTGTFIPAEYIQVHPRGHSTQCVDVRSAEWDNGTPVQLWDCNDSVAQAIVIHGGYNRPGRVHWIFGWTPNWWPGPSYEYPGWCLDAGTNPRSGSRVKIWECYRGLYQQTWVYDGSRLRIAGSNLCLDVTDGHFSPGNQLQVWECTPGNPNQRFDTSGGTGKCNSVCNNNPEW